MTTKKYTLKRGRHQFAPGSHAGHENDNLSDEEAKWYLEQYPHIAALFETMPGNTNEILSQPSLSFGEGRGEAACRVSVTTEPAKAEIQSPESTDGSEITNLKSVKSLPKSVKSKK